MPLSHFLKIHFNIILPSVPRSSKCHISTSVQIHYSYCPVFWCYIVQLLTVSLNKLKLNKWLQLIILTSVCIGYACKCLYNSYVFIPVTCMRLNQVYAAYRTVTQHFLFPFSFVITKAIYMASCCLLQEDKLCIVSDQMILNFPSSFLSVHKQLNGPSQSSYCQNW